MKTIHSITEFQRLVSLPDPLHPLISVVEVAQMQFTAAELWQQFSLDFYCVSLKKGVVGKVKYGQQYYDYDKGVMTFIAPKQIQLLDEPHPDMLNPGPARGYALLIHPDFLYGHPLAAAIKNFGFFSYAVNEALHLSEKEEAYIAEVFRKIQEECAHIDRHTQDIVLAQLDLLFNYSIRFYERQFITRKAVNHDVLTKMEQLLNTYFEQDESLKQGLPTVEMVAGKLNLSPHYLSDMLRSLTGRSAQLHIQEKVIEKAKEYLSVTSLSVAEIAYQLGFEYPQSFNKMFKKKMNISPLEYRQSFN
ncbi:AraC-like DNA-binding protein [Filimonas zeae]|uniref:AraC family transcriptional regulator n=1 Tax=Filimonas zeae TaxID=1737353 RepID=A0A917MU09_9BACT|nr:helix-turn-helix transcriptional regulator [Filimonas zeae]MDR6339402.1 AraC-like DNA-binding protein [Filimonas zeae]GGH63759.1 AraC family transcriptional regulator [Filimonas zeae]